MTDRELFFAIARGEPTDRLYFCPLEVVRSSDVDFAKLKWRMVEDRDVFQGANYSYSEYVQLLAGGNPGY